jgi:hypothetical protein
MMHGVLLDFCSLNFSSLVKVCLDDMQFRFMVDANVNVVQI